MFGRDGNNCKNQPYPVYVRDLERTKTFYEKYFGATANDQYHNPATLELWIVWFIASVALMVLYEMFWIRYFKSEKSVKDFYRPLFGIPAPGAALPVIAFLLLGIYGKVIWLIASAVILGIGHIGIHLHTAHKGIECKRIMPKKTFNEKLNSPGDLRKLRIYQTNLKP